MKPFLILGPLGESFELTSFDKFLDEYEPLGYTVPAVQAAQYEVPDIAAIKAEREAQASQQVIDLTKLSRADLEAEAVKAGIENPASFPNKGALVDAIAASFDTGEHDEPGTGDLPVVVEIDAELIADFGDVGDDTEPGQE